LHWSILSSRQPSSAAEIGTATRRAINIVSTRSFSQQPTTIKAFFNYAHLLRIRPVPTVPGIGDRKDFNFRSVSMVEHSAGTAHDEG
jgi:hypothetical protein